MRPRGERNNNPGNIRHGERWQGLAPQQTDPNFCQFTSAHYGIRALCKTLLTYQRKHDRKTVESILFRWAPPVENDTEAYIEHVASQVGVGPRQQINLEEIDMLFRLTKAVITHENGQCIYTDDEIADAALDALK